MASIKHLKLPAREARYSELFIGLVVMLVLGPIFGEYPIADVARDFALTVVLVLGLRTVLRAGGFFQIACASALLAAVAHWAGYAGGGRLPLLAAGSAALFFLVIAIPVITDVLRAGEVTLQHLCGAAAAYLLLAVFWTYLYVGLELFRGDAFTGVGLHDQSGAVVVHAFAYFSLVTLSTLGYGDIVPVIPEARSLAALEAIVGQLYLAMLIARLVSQYSAIPKSEG